MRSRQHRKYWLFGVEVTPVARCHAVTMEDRESVYQPTVVSGQKPMTLGHNYSLMAAISESDSTLEDRQVGLARGWLLVLLFYL